MTAAARRAWGDGAILRGSLTLAPQDELRCRLQAGVVEPATSPTERLILRCPRQRASKDEPRAV